MSIGIHLLLLLVSSAFGFSPKFSKWDRFQKLSILSASRPQIKGVKHMHLTRPRKTRPSLINPKPLLHHNKPDEYEGAPPEYIRIPVKHTLSIVENPKMCALIHSVCKMDGPDSMSISKAAEDPDVIHDLETINDIGRQHNDSISTGIYYYLRKAIDTLGEDPSLQPDYIYTKYEYKWEKHQYVKLNQIIKQRFNQLRLLALRLSALGTPPYKLKDIHTWYRYRLFEAMPNTSFVDEFIARQKIVWEGPKPGETLRDAYLRIFSEYGVLDSTGSYNATRAKEIELQSDVIAKLTSVANYIYKYTDPTYVPLTNRTLIEEQLDAELRREYIEKRLSVLFDAWIDAGTPPPPPPVPDIAKHDKMIRDKTTKKRVRREALREKINQINLRKYENQEKMKKKSEKKLATGVDMLKEVFATRFLS